MAEEAAVVSTAEEADSLAVAPTVAAFRAAVITAAPPVMAEDMVSPEAARTAACAEVRPRCAALALPEPGRPKDKESAIPRPGGTDSNDLGALAVCPRAPAAPEWPEDPQALASPAGQAWPPTPGSPTETSTRSAARLDLAARLPWPQAVESLAIRSTTSVLSAAMLRGAARAGGQAGEAVGVGDGAVVGAAADGASVGDGVGAGDGGTRSGHGLPTGTTLGSTTIPPTFIRTPSGNSRA